MRTRIRFATRFSRLLVTGLTLAAVCCGATALQAEEQSRIGHKIDGFRLPDYYGRTRTLDEFADSKAIVVAFLGTDCPLVKLYAPRLAELAKEYEARGVTFLGVNSNQQDTMTYIGAFARQHGVTFPILKDLGNTVADDFGAVRTPEVFVLDQQRVIRYWGRVDDQYGLGAASGYAKNEIRRRDLAEAVEEVLAGKEVSQPVTKAYGCLIGRVPRVTPHGEITYTKHVAHIIQNKCVECHRPSQVAPMDLTSYEQVSGWSEMIREVISDGRMPPWFANPAHGEFKNDARMTEEEKNILYQWVECGCPKGDDADLPEPRKFVEGWTIGQPDVVFQMADEPYEVQAEGTIDYQYFVVETGFKEDRWIKAAEARPGNRAVVHHIICFIGTPGRPGAERSSGASIGYAPGMQARVFGEGMAMKIPAGATLRFQMHYTATGKPEKDLSSVGFIFADPKEVKREVKGGLSGNVSFQIPPHAENYEVKSRKKFRRDTLLLSMLPHMHVRGKSFRYELEYPDGQREILLDVPRYDFNWQLWYSLAEPKLIPKGSKIYCTALFDNSANNPFNPDPTAEITWGEQTWEEMMFGFMTFADPYQDLTGTLTEREDQGDPTEAVTPEEEISPDRTAL